VRFADELTQQQPASSGAEAADRAPQSTPATAAAAALRPGLALDRDSAVPRSFLPFLAVNNALPPGRKFSISAAPPAPAAAAHAAVPAGLGGYPNVSSSRASVQQGPPTNPRAQSARWQSRKEKERSREKGLRLGIGIGIGLGSGANGDPSQLPTAWSYAAPSQAQAQAQAQDQAQAGSVASGLPWGVGGSLASISLDAPQLQPGNVVGRAPPRGKHAVNAALLGVVAAGV
jgi:hypothetical protein